MDAQTTQSESACLEEVKRMTERLNLNARRPSIVRWKAENEDGAFVARLSNSTSSNGGHFGGRFMDISDAINWIKKELMCLKEQDYALARQLISIRTELSKVKLRFSCSEHRALLEDAALDADEHEDDILGDLPSELGRCPQSLRGIGITRMNLCSRRFSLS